jgi:2-polyprenyl-3-methyl-5-hydroxy-6-metoxy-1,4-benzoquinol methylase
MSNFRGRTKIMKITERNHWENVNSQRKDEKQRALTGLRAWFALPPARTLFYQICDRFFKPDQKKTVFEVGCAPGKRLLEFSTRYKYIPYGVEYTEAGVEAVRTEFKSKGIPENHCIFSDVFEPSFQKDHREKFDAVISYGFIEHFTNVEEVIDTHINLLKPGGLLLIMIPNLRGIYYPLLKCLNPDLISKHNLNIMRMKTFRGLFSSQKLAPLFYGFYGVLNMGVLYGKKRWQIAIVRSLQFLFAFLNPLLRYAHAFENRWTSPYLMFIGGKK